MGIVTRDGLIESVRNFLDEKYWPVCVGVDIGKIQDNTTIAVAEVLQVQTGKYRQITPIPMHVDHRGFFVPPKDAEPLMRSEYTIRYIQRLPLGTSYPAVAEHITAMLCNPLFNQRKVRVLIDSTGVGQAIYDMVRQEIGLRRETRQMHIKPITFTHGEKYNRTTGALGKAYLVSRLQSLLQSGRVHAPDTAEVRATLEELRVYQVKIDDAGKDTYGAIVGKHDDLATALALCCLEDPHSEKVTYSERVY